MVPLDSTQLTHVGSVFDHVSIDVRKHFWLFIFKGLPLLELILVGFN